MNLALQAPVLVPLLVLEWVRSARQAELLDLAHELPGLDIIGPQGRQLPRMRDRVIQTSRIATEHGEGGQGIRIRRVGQAYAAKEFDGLLSAPVRFQSDGKHVGVSREVGC